MATRRHYIDHDDTKPREKNEYYEVREYNIDENVMDKYWRESGKPARYQRFDQRQNYRRQQADIPWYFILGAALVALLLFTLKPPSGNITVKGQTPIVSADGKNVTVTATIENTSGAMLFDLYCTAELRDSEQNTFSQGRTEVAAFVFPSSKKSVTITLPTYGHTGAFTAKIEAKGKHIIWGLI